MAKILVVYESKFGNTKRVAEAIAEGIKGIPGSKVWLGTPKEVNRNELAEYDAYIVGSPNHMGNALHGILGFIGELGKIKSEGKLIAVFDTYRGVYNRPRSPQFQLATKKMEERIVKKAPSMKLVAPGLSIMVLGKEGPIADGELPKAEKFGADFARLAGGPRLQRY